MTMMIVMSTLMGMRIDWFRVVGDFLEDVCRRDDPRLSPVGKKFAKVLGKEARSPVLFFHLGLGLILLCIPR